MSDLAISRVRNVLKGLEPFMLKMAGRNANQKKTTVKVEMEDYRKTIKAEVDAFFDGVFRGVINE